MKCKWSTQELALSAGHDLDQVSEQELRRHLAECPDCHDQWNRFRDSTAVLEQAASEDFGPTESPQLWASVSRKLPRPSQPRSKSSHSWTLANTWVPLVAAASLILALVSISGTLDQLSYSTQAGSFGTHAENPNNSHSVYDADVRGQAANFDLPWRSAPEHDSPHLSHELPIDRLNPSRDSRNDLPEYYPWNGNFESQQVK
ncbi:MAG: zf-HC2 domain-containing protein [Planctomycetaceae bacterium]|nr:zf-HC2 domain-containing protein [Planctomycetaceae bacterium]